MNETTNETTEGKDLEALVPLHGQVSFDLCLDGSDMCGTPFFQVCCTAECPQSFVRGDPNGDNSFNISDPIFELEILFGPATTECLHSLDVNDDDAANLVDVFYLLDALFMMGPLPLAPFPNCGFDTTPGILDCATYVSCP